jgi:magnesium chelatase family protein
MVGISLSYATLGIDAYQISVESDRGSGNLFMVNIVGMATNAVREARTGFAAIKKSGYDSASVRYTINLAPADIKKDSSALDLPIAVAVLQSNRELKTTDYRKIGIIGELSLDGNVRPCIRSLPIAIAARRDRLDYPDRPYENAEEAAIIEGIK